MRALKLAVSFVKVPRLFASLILFPLILSTLVVSAQMFVTRIAMRSLDRDTSPFLDGVKRTQENSVLRVILYGDGGPRPQLKVCRWNKKMLRDGDFIEVPPGKECSPDRLDAAVQTASPNTFDATKYEELLNGSFERLHICERDCKPDLVMNAYNTTPTTNFKSPWVMMLLAESRITAISRTELFQGLEETKAFKGLIGDQFLHITGLREPIRMKRFYTAVAVVMNVCGLVIVALWLALKAHRKVLDYFARSGALLPMVAATGRGTFYSAIWLLTLFRVGAFILAAVPIVIIGLRGGLREGEGALLPNTTPSEAILWLIALVVTMGFATLVASIAELKHRHSLLSLAYKFIPLILATVGGIIWCFTLIGEGETVSMVRDTISALPLFGMAPMLVAPIIKPKFGIFVIHTLLTTVLIAIAAKHNARWFAAHLEEI